LFKQKKIEKLRFSLEFILFSNKKKESTGTSQEGCTCSLYLNGIFYHKILR